MARERSCNSPACKELMPVKWVKSYLRDGTSTSIALAMCPKCDVLQCDNPSCRAYYSDPRAQRCPTCNTRFGLNIKKGN